MSTLIGSSDTNIYIIDGEFRVTVGGDIALEIVADPSSSNPGVEFATKAYVDSLSVNDLANQSGNYNAEGFKFTNIADPVENYDIATKAYVDQESAISEGIADVVIETSSLLANQQELTNGTTPINMNDQRITGLSTAEANTDCISRESGDSRFYLKTTTLDQLSANTSDLSVNEQKITNLANPSNDGDMANKGYIDTIVFNTRLRSIENTETTSSSLTAQQNELVIGETPLNMSAQIIKNLGNPVDSDDAVNKSTADSQSVSIETTLDQVALPNGPINANNQRIGNLGIASSLTDAGSLMSVQAADARYYKQTDTLSDIEAPTASLSLNNHAIVNLSDPSDNSDMATKQYTDNLIVILNGAASSIQNPTNSDSSLTANLADITIGNVHFNMNTQPIEELANATAATDVLNMQTGDERYYSNSATLDSISAPQGHVTMASSKITSLGDATDVTDALNLEESDSRYYSVTTPLNSLAAPIASLSVSSEKITNVPNPTTDSDAMNLQTATNRYYSNSTPLQSLASAISPLDMNGNKISDVSNPTLSNQVASKEYVDDTFLSNSNGLSDLTAEASVSAGAEKISNLGNATTGTDALNMQSGDSRYYLNTTTLDQITVPTSTLSLSSEKITSLANATVATDALNLETANNRYQLETTPLNSIPEATESVNFAGNAALSVGDAVSDEDLLNRETGDNRYYSNTTTLNNITAPLSNLSLNSNKITNIAQGSESEDAVVFGQIEALVSSLGYKRVYSGWVYVGDLLSAADSWGGVITNVTSGSGGSINWFTLTHTAIPFNYVVICNMYSNRIASGDNDPNGHLVWIYPINNTSTRIVFEFDSSGDGGRAEEIGYNVAFIEN